MTIEKDCCKSTSEQGVRRRDFVKLIILTGILVGGITDRKSTAAQISEPTTKPAEIPAYSAEDFNRMAYCGIRCQAACPEHEYPESCDGCKSKGEKLGHYCRICTIRKCASEKQVLTCAHCAGYSSCEADTWKKYPILMEKINKIRMELL